MRKYKSGIFLCKLKLNEEGTALICDVPFKYYGINLVQNGKPVNLNDTKLAGTEVLAKLDYRTQPHANPDVKVEKDIAEAHAGYLGNEWGKIKKDARYLKHYSRTKEDSLATYDKDGVKTEYDGVDKEEASKFCEWGEDVEEEPVEIIKEIK